MKYAKQLLENQLQQLKIKGQKLEDNIYNSETDISSKKKELEETRNMVDSLESALEILDK